MYAFMALRKQRVYYEPQRRACTLDFPKCVFPPGAITQQSRHSVIILSYVVVVRPPPVLGVRQARSGANLAVDIEGILTSLIVSGTRSHRTKPSRPSFECVTLLTLSGYAVTYQRFSAERPPDGAPPVVKKH